LEDCLITKASPIFFAFPEHLSCFIGHFLLTCFLVPFHACCPHVSLFHTAMSSVSPSFIVISLLSNYIKCFDFWLFLNCCICLQSVLLESCFNLLWKKHWMLRHVYSASGCS
jgi:hypothetical protein